MAKNTSSLEDFQQLRQKIDDDDPFVNGGHQIIHSRKRKRETPVWAKDKEQVRQLLLRSFPSLKTNDTHRKRASRWARVIYLYFVTQMTYSEVAEEMKMTPNVLRRVLASIRYAASGLRADCSKRPFGKKSVPIQTTLGEQGKDDVSTLTP